MFSIEWLRAGEQVERQLTGLRDSYNILEIAKLRTEAVRRRHKDREPDRFEVADGTGSLLVVCSL